ncbi:MAG: MlaA family lipoprotein [Luteolibacter sp.]
MSTSAMAAILVASCGAPGIGDDVTGGPRPTEGAGLVQDPYEPFNRAAWEVNRRLNLALLEPASDFYQAAIPQRMRRSIGNVRENLAGPLRLTNQALQGRWEDSGRESARFLTNSTLGIGGLFDVAGKMDLAGSSGNFNQTFRHWGWQPDTYLVLPVLGPSDNVAAPARVMDIAADPANYVEALQPVAYVTRFHQASEITVNSAPVMRTEADSYSLIRQAWPYLNRTTPPDWTLRGAPDMPTLESLGAVRQGPRDPRFLRNGRKHYVRIPHTGRDLPYNAWIQKKPAALVFLNPGIGSHRESRNTLALAEAFHSMGFSVVTMSGIFHPEFMERGASAKMPGNPLRDRADVLAACTAIDADVRRKYRRHEVTKRVLAGFSLGGFTALQLAATEAGHAPGSVRFDHYLAIQSPVDLKASYETLDRYFDAPSAWPAEEREARMDLLFHKTAAGFNGSLPAGVVPFDGDESRTLVGYGFRMILRDATYSIHAREPQAGLTHQASHWKREATHQELMETSFDDYFTGWLRPAELNNGTSERLLMEKITLRSMEEALRSNPRISFIGNRNDFLLSGEDIRWLSTTLGRRATWLPSGGHLGNIGDPVFLETLEDVCGRFR